MAKKIYLTESQFKDYLRVTMLSEAFGRGVHKTAETRTAGQKVLEYVVPAERQLQKLGMSLFADPEWANMLPDIAQGIDAPYTAENKIVLRWKPRLTKREQEIANNDGVFLDPENFADEQAFQLVNQWIMGEPYKGVNKYAEALGKLSAERQNETAEMKRFNELVAKYGMERAKNMIAREEKFKGFFKSVKFTCHAINFYEKWKGGQFPIERADGINILQYNEVLMPYFQKERGYKTYQGILDKIKSFGIWAFDGIYLYTPTVGGIKEDENGKLAFGVSERTGKINKPLGWDSNVEWLRSHNIGLLRSKNGLYIKKMEDDISYCVAIKIVPPQV